jgi:hypothetical protein
MPRHLQIGNVRGNKFPHQDGTNKVVCKVQILGTNLVSNPTHGVRNNNQQDGTHKTLRNSNSLLAGADLTRLHSNKLLVGDRRLRNNNLPPGMRKTLRNSNSLPPGMRRGQQIQGDSSRGKHLLLRLMRGHNLSRALPRGGNRVTNLLHQQHMAMVAVQVSRGHNQLK